MWETAAPFVREWIRDELGPEAAIADRLIADFRTLARLPELIRRIEERYPAPGGAPPAPPLREIEVVRIGGGWRYALVAVLAAAAGVAATLALLTAWAVRRRMRRRSGWPQPTRFAALSPGRARIALRCWSCCCSPLPDRARPRPPRRRPATPPSAPTISADVVAVRDDRRRRARTAAIITPSPPRRCARAIIRCGPSSPSACRRWRWCRRRLPPGRALALLYALALAVAVAWCGRLRGGLRRGPPRGRRDGAARRRAGRRSSSPSWSRFHEIWAGAADRAVAGAAAARPVGRGGRARPARDADPRDRRALRRWSWPCSPGARASGARRSAGSRALGVLALALGRACLCGRAGRTGPLDPASPGWAGCSASASSSRRSTLVDRARSSLPLCGRRAAGRARAVRLGGVARSAGAARAGDRSPPMPLLIGAVRARRHLLLGADGRAGLPASASPSCPTRCATCAAARARQAAHHA